jgi:hypothetical protein
MNERSTAFIRDWYRGPWDLNQSSTSASTRREMGCFATGSTISAEAQKSSGNPRSSRGDVRSMVASETRRSRDSSARPRLGPALGRWFVRLTLTATAHSGRNDATDPFTGLGPVGVDDRQHDAIGFADRDDPTLAVVTTRIFALQGGPVEYLRREVEVEASLAQTAVALPSIPPEAHGVSIRLYIRRRNRMVELGSRRTRTLGMDFTTRQAPQRPSRLEDTSKATISRDSLRNSRISISSR